METEGMDVCRERQRAWRGGNEGVREGMVGERAGWTEVDGKWSRERGSGDK